MFSAIMSRAWEDRLPTASAPTACDMAARTSGGRLVDVCTIKSKTLSDNWDNIPFYNRTYWRSVLALVPGQETSKFDSACEKLETRAGVFSCSS